MTPRCILDFPLEDQGPHTLLSFGEPQVLLVAHHLNEVRTVLQDAEDHARAGCWVVGLVSYDAAPAFDAALKTPGHETHLPLAWFAVFDAPLNHCTPPQPATAMLPASWQPAIKRQRFNEDIAYLRQAIFNGEVYQVNHTLRLGADSTLDAAAIYSVFNHLRQAHPTSYAAFIDLGPQQILSLSPELFFRRDGELITTRPMKGTARRGRWATEDAAIGDWLHHSEKNRAENLMIVDLLRNDLSRIARPHSVQVSDLFAVKHHPTVWQMTSTIRAHTRPGISLNDLFTALFPCGSVTGAPKPRAMTLIAEREEQARGVYCGAIGLLRPGGDAIFNVAIRTARFQSGQAICGVGGGITWNSTADDEYAEALLKARFLDPAALPERVPLFETLRLENTDYWLLDRHLARLAGSAAYFDYPCDIAACHQALATLAQENPQGAWRVRLTLQADGTITTHVAPLPAPPEHARFTLATAAVNRNALWLHHKTMQRSFFDQALAAAQTTQPGIFDVLLHNEDGELTEFTRGNLVLEINGARYTPPLTSGLLDGTLRRELLERGEIIERILRQEDLLHATRILFINSLRGEIPLFIVS